MEAIFTNPYWEYFCKPISPIKLAPIFRHTHYQIGPSHPWRIRQRYPIPCGFYGQIDGSKLVVLYLIFKWMFIRDIHPGFPKFLYVFFFGQKSCDRISVISFQWIFIPDSPVIPDSPSFHRSQKLSLKRSQKRMTGRLSARMSTGLSSRETRKNGRWLFRVSWGADWRRYLQDIWLVVWNMNFMFPYTVLGIIIPTDFHIFQRGWNHQPVIYLMGFEEV